MSFAAWRGLRFASKLHTPARRIAGRRYPIRLLRALHTSPSHSVWPFPPIDPSQNPSQSKPVEYESVEARAEREALQNHGGDASVLHESAAEGANGAKERSHDRGSAFKRSMRNRRPKEIPPIHIPGWFLNRNVKLRGDAKSLSQEKETLEVIEDGVENIDTAHSIAGGGTSQQNTQDASPGSSGGSKFRISSKVMMEIKANLAAGLVLSRQDVMETFAGSKAHVKLHCPIDGADYFLDKIVEDAAAQLNADLVRLDAQDLAEIAGDYMREGPNASADSLWTMGYDVQKITPRMHEVHIEEAEEEGVEEDEANSQDDPFKDERGGGIPGFSAIKGFPVVGVTTSMKGLNGFLNTLTGGGGSSGSSRGFFDTNRNGSRALRVSNQFGDVHPNQVWNDLKLNALLDALVDATHTKRRTTVSQGADGTLEGQNFTTEGAVVKDSDLQDDVASKATDADSDLSSHSIRTVLQIRGLKELAMIPQGGSIMEKIVQIVQNRRMDNHQIVIVGTTASEDLAPELSRTDVQNAQSEGPESLYRTVFVTPQDDHALSFNACEIQRTMDINIRHLLDAIVRLEPDYDVRRSLGSASKFRQDLNSISVTLGGFGSSLGDRLWTFDEIHRIALTAIGNKASASPESVVKELTAKDVTSALSIILQSDGAKVEWLRQEKQLQQVVEPERPKINAAEQRLRRVRKTCNRHEKRLLGGVIDPENLRTTFKDVHAAPETIEALKTLTTLSLTRPDAFTYGVLATDKLSGLLLYGPPGTGKTLLAKAVAKESGATVLEVSGSDVYDMYVGESEKNVRAIFSLAKKLSPCVVFIDEADAIFASRGGAGSQRSAHRELINQFLKEWDGLTDTTAFIMVATNRPFDLDDAALRRLPRRLLVDLPSAADREAILRIHLAGEALDAEVSLSALSERTHLYSGSDLKNLAVAAALAAVREENETAEKAGRAATSLLETGEGESSETATMTTTAQSVASPSSSSSSSSQPQSVPTSQPSNLTTPTSQSQKEETNDPNSSLSTSSSPSSPPPNQPQAQAQAHSQPQPHKYPPHRTLFNRHFDRALEEISASVSEDMSSLSAIRKFDEKYGDKRGRRKKRGGYGFALPSGGGGGGGLEREREVVRVRV